MDNERPLQFFVDKKRLGMAFGILLGMLLVFVAPLWSPRMSVFEIVMISPCILILLLVLPVVVAELARRSPAIEMSDEGVRWKVGVFRGAASWDEIMDARCFGVGGSWWIRLSLADQAAFEARHAGWRSWVLRNMKPLFGPVTCNCIPGSGIAGVRAGALADSIRKRARKKAAMPRMS